MPSKTFKEYCLERNRNHQENKENKKTPYSTSFSNGKRLKELKCGHCLKKHLSILPLENKFECILKLYPEFCTKANFKNCDEIVELSVVFSNTIPIYEKEILLDAQNCYISQLLKLEKKQVKVVFKSIMNLTFDRFK